LKLSVLHVNRYQYSYLFFSFVLCKKKKEREKKVAQSIILRVFFVAFLLYCESAICGVEHAEVTVKKKTIQQVCMQKVFHFVSL
jgi:hypothetical protein